MSSFSNPKEIRVVITLGTGKFGSSNNNQITLEGYRCVIDIDKAGWQQMGKLRAQIYGMSQSDMNAATVLQWKVGYLIDTNAVDVYAIDGGQETLIFSGNIVNAWGDYTSMPEVFFQVQAQTAFHASLTPVAPLSYNGSVDVATVIGQIAQGMGMHLENNGVSVQLSDVYLPNTNLIQLKAICNMANIDWYIDDDTIAICPKGVARGSLIPEISKLTGLRGYPTFDGKGVNFQTFFTPAITFGGNIKLTSDLQQATGQWLVSSLSHRLESEKPNGSWFSNVRGIPSGIAIV